MAVAAMAAAFWVAVSEGLIVGSKPMMSLASTLICWSIDTEFPL